MPFYKDTNNQLHFLDSADFEHLLPVGCIAITDAEGGAIEAANNPPQPAVIPDPVVTQSQLQSILTAAGLDTVKVSAAMAVIK